MSKKFEFTHRWSSKTDPGLANTPNKTIQKNIKRRSSYVNNVKILNRVPLPSWIELSLIDTCNRACIFCPRSNSLIAPNTNQQMENALIDKMVSDLREMNFKGTINLCGYGEPMLHKNINAIIKKLSSVAMVELVTNGDVVNAKKLKELEESKISKILISMYDGPHQIEKFNKMVKESKIKKNLVTLRDRWYSEDKDFGLALSNRAGTVEIKNKSNFNPTKCFYPSYSIMIDWNGNVYLCPNDWQRRVAQGNMMQKGIFEIWTGSMITKYRKKLLEGKRDISPCKECNAKGTFLGSNHAAAWGKYYNS